MQNNSDSSPERTAGESGREELLRARRLMERGDLKAARVLARMLVDRDKSYGAACLIGEIFLADGSPKAAEGVFAQLIQMLPADVSLRVLLAESLRQQRRQEEAETVFRPALSQAPGDPAVGMFLAKILHGQGRRQDARRIVEDVHARCPEYLEAANALARLLEAEGRSEAAETMLRESLVRWPDHPIAARALGDFLKRRGLLEEAQQWHWRSAGFLDAGPPRQPGARRKVVFIAQHGSFWPNMASVHAAFAADPAWETIVVAMPYYHRLYSKREDREHIFGYLQREGIPYIRWDQFPLGPRFAEVVFLPVPYEVTRAAGWRTFDLMRHGVRLAYVPYCIETGQDTADYRNQYDQMLQQVAWAVFARSEAHRLRFRRFCETGCAHVAVTGHPKMDALRSLDTVHDPAMEAFAAGRRTVCWNPHFDVRLGETDFGTGYSTFLRWWRFLPAEFARRPELALIIRPHPLMFQALVENKILSPAQIDDFVARCEQAGNICIDRGPSYLPAFAVSHAMLSDLSSFVLEYPLTGKPLLYLKNPYGILPEEGVMPGDYCPAAETEEQIRAFLDLVASGTDPRAAERTAACRQVMHLPADRSVGAEIKRVIEARLAV